MRHSDDYWLSLKVEALERVRSRYPRDKVHEQDKVIYFCSQIAYRLRHLYKEHTLDLEFQKKVDKLINSAVDELLDLPVDVISYISDKEEALKGRETTVYTSQGVSIRGNSDHINGKKSNY